MATQLKKILCDYCDKELSDKYMLERHQKTSKQCIKIQSLEEMSNEFNYELILQNFDVDRTRTSYQYIAMFIEQYFITQKNYITTDKKRFIGKYIINNQLKNDIGFEFITKIYSQIMQYIVRKNMSDFCFLSPSKSLSKSKLSTLPAIIRNYISNQTYYKGPINTPIKKAITKPNWISKFESESKSKPTKPTKPTKPKQDPSGGIAQESKQNIGTYICPCDNREHCITEKNKHRETKTHLKYVQHIYDNQLTDKIKELKDLFNVRCIDYDNEEEKKNDYLKQMLEIE